MESKEEYWGTEILKLCPILYQMYDKPMTQTCMCWGFECGKGWKNNIEDMSCELETLNIQFYSRYKVRIQMDQVKEKFGYLTCYYSIQSDNDTELNQEQSVISNYLNIKAQEIIDKYEKKCYNTCEDCGTQIGTDWSPRIETKGWINYICDDCYKKREGEYRPSQV